jgi:hypothetical protein
LDDDARRLRGGLRALAGKNCWNFFRSFWRCLALRMLESVWSSLAAPAVLPRLAQYSAQESNSWPWYL